VRVFGFQFSVFGKKYHFHYVHVHYGFRAISLLMSGFIWHRVFSPSPPMGDGQSEGDFPFTAVQAKIEA
jgi:hypothetical protein